MAKQLNVNLAFTADTSKAKQQLQELQSSLDKLISSTNTKTGELGLTKELSQASVEANKLKILLEKSTSSTGTLDLGKFSQGLKQSGKELKDYANTLQSLGPEGAQAFAKLAQSITTANVPLKQSNKLLQEFATTMKNTVRWQFSSSMLHGFMGAMSGALSYAKDLDKSLNDIRIVTGYNSDQMAHFAVEANKAAKALSATTTEYTNASLIYFQQGLSDEEVAKRTETTIKMANVTGTTAQQVSDQMTAVWNNFDDGSKSLEYYADVMTALGAATASSTDEISEGLNKFAAVSKTVGLSYEYATAALATVTATTRESADVVGTAFKTLFARIQGLQLGETLDDGTTLNKYSQALASVGISIKDSNGELKQMDTILDEMGSKWNTMSTDQQTALAQTVAGVRQYGQLMALMNNWDYFKENVEVAEKSTGTLKEQAEIYAESWEASSKRVKAAAQGIYDKILDEDFFIGVNNILEESLGFISNLIDGLGGLPGVLSLVASWMLKAFGPDIAASMERIAYNIKLTSKAGQEEILATRKQANQETREMYSNSADAAINNPAKVDIINAQTGIQDKLIDKVFELEKAHKSLTEEEQKQAQLLLDQNQALGDQYENIVKIKREQDRKDDKSIRNISIKTKGLKDDQGADINVKGKLNDIKKIQSEYSTGITLLEKYRATAKKALAGEDGKEQAKVFEQLKEHLISFQKSAVGAGQDLGELNEIFKNFQGAEDLEIALNEMEEALDGIGTKAYTDFETFRQALQNAGGDMKKLNPELDAIWESFSKTGELTADQIQTFANFGIQIEKSGKIIEGFNGKVYTTADTLVAVANIATNVASVFNSIKGLSDIWSNEDLSFGEKMVSTLSTMGVVVGTLISTYENFNAAKLAGVTNDILALAVQQKKNQADGTAIGLHFSENALQAIENGQLTTEIILKTILNALDLKKIAIYAALALAIGAVVVVAKLLYDAYNKDAQGAKEASEQAQMLAERYEEAKNAAQELKDTISDWTEAHNALSELEKGTEEYAAALADANEKAKELIETYGLWNDYTVENGVIKFNDGVLENLQQEADEKANQAENQMYGSKIYANQAQVRSETTNQKRNTASFGTGTYSYYDGGQVENTRKLSDSETQYISEVAQNLKESLGGVSPTAEQLREKLSELNDTEKLGADALNNLSTIITDKTIGGFISLGESMDEAAESNLYYAKQILENSVEKNYGSDISQLATNKDGEVDAGRYETLLDIYTNKASQLEADKENNIADQYANVESDVKDIVNTSDLNAFLNKYEQDNNELIKSVLGESYDGNIGDDKELGLMYASMLSGQDVSTLTYEGGWGVGTEEGKTIVDGVSDEVMRREIAKQVAMEKITQDAAASTGESAQDLESLKNALTNIVEGGSKAGEKYGADFSSAILNAISNQNFETLDFSSLFSELSPEEMAELSGMGKDGILGMLGISEDDLVAAGYNVDTFVAAFSSALDQWTYSLDTADIEEKAASLKDIAEDAQFGDIIDQEAIDKLAEAGVNTDKYFTQMEDGTYKLTGAAEEFKRVVEGITVQDYINKLQEFNSAQEYAKSQVGQNYDSGTMSNLTNSSVVGDTDLGAARADYINTFEGTDFGFSDDQLSVLSKDSSQYTDEDLQTLANMMDIVANKSIELQAQMLSTADSMNELNNAVAIASAQGIDVTYDAYSQALLGLASSYENCAEEAERYQKALASADEVQVHQAESALKASIHIGEAAKKYDLNAKSLEAQTKEIMKANNMTEEQAEQAAQMAVQNQRLNKGLSQLVNGWKDWKKVLTSTDKTSQDYADTLVELSGAVQELVGWYEDLSLDSTFVEENMGLIEQAAEGNMSAIIALGGEVANYSVAMSTLDTTLANGLMADGAINAFEAYRQAMGDATEASDAFLSVQAGVVAGFDNIIANAEALTNGSIDLSQAFGGDAGLEAWVNQLNAYAAATGMTADEMQTMLSSVGVTANVQSDYQEQDMTVPTYREEVTSVNYRRMPLQTIDPYTGDIIEGETMVPEYTKAQVPGEPLDTKGYVEVASISMDGEGEGPSIDPPKFTGRQAPSSSAAKGGKTSGSSGGGSSGSITKSNKSTKRYKTVDDKMDDSNRSSERLKNRISKTTGQEQKDLMDKLIAEEKHYKKLVKDKLKEAKDYLEDDYADLNAAAAVVDVEFEFDAEGNIINYEEEMSSLYERLDQAENDALADGEVTEAEQELIDKLQEQVETLEDAIATYDETRETVEDLEDELEDLAGMPPLPTATSDLVDIYKEVNDELDDIEDRLEKINDESDRLTGAAKIKKLREAADIEKEKLQTLKEQAKVINEDIAEKQENLDEVAARHGLSFNYDENGNITNYDEEMGRLTDEYQSMYEEYAADGEITEAEQANLDAKQDAIDEITGYADAYSSAVEEGEENAKEQLASKYAIQDKNAEALTLALEMRVEINERDLQRIDYYLGKMEDDFYSAAEAAALMVGNLNGEGSSFGEGGQLGAYLANLNAYQTSFADLQAAYENGDISQADYVAGLEAASDGMYENLQNLQDLDDAMMNYYANTLAAAGEEIAKYTDQMEHQSSVLDHYKSIMEIMGKSNDYKKMGKILEGQASLAKDQAQVAKQTMEMYKGEADKKYALYQEALARGDSAAAELYKKEYEAALQASSDAEEQYLAKTEAYAESLKAILENKLADLGQDLENALTGGTSFDQLASGLSRAASIQEEYLTTTNQIYETNKLMRTAQQEIDKTSNSIAKNRLKQFINETDQLQNQNKLSKYELEIQQAKYNLLLAEIAAEEAQSAKSTVRLQRDSEGNFGYVYTADSSKMAEAEQKLQDAQNRLYNIGLDGANQYTEKYQQTLSEMYSTLTDLQSQYLSGAFESEEEYNNAVTAAKEYYYEKLEQYSSLHAVALTTDSRVIEDAWSTQFSTMVYSTESWKNSVNDYVDEAAQAFIDWKAEMTNIETELGLDDIETAVDDVKTASQELAEELTKDGGVIDSLKDELTEVGKVTEEYANQRTTIQGLITDYEDLATSIDATIQKMLEIPEGGGLPTDSGDDDDDDDTGGNNQDDNDDDDDDTGGNNQDDDDDDGDTGGNNQDDDDDTGGNDDDEGGGDPAPQTGTWERIMQAYEKICSGAWGNGLENRIAKGVAEGFTEDEVRKAQQYINYTFPPSRNGLGYSAAKAKSLLGFDTGGYTGDWGGAYGKMALLHKKELVLNEGDTENFLQSMNLLDKIVAAIDLHSMNAQLGGLLSSPSIGGMQEQGILEQQVHIEASFPNATNHSEIEEAFKNLVNQASQYANRK